jgi:hypothetical protein
MRRFIAATIAAALVTAPVGAQQIGPFADTQRGDVRATVGITLPLGARNGDAASRARAELRLEPGRAGGAAPPGPISTRRNLNGVVSSAHSPAPPTLALTLGSSPRWMAGGRVLGADQDETPEDDDGIDTLEGIGIGVGVVLGLGAAAVGVLLLSLECDADEECS